MAGCVLPSQPPSELEEFVCRSRWQVWLSSFVCAFQTFLFFFRKRKLLPCDLYWGFQEMFSSSLEKVNPRYSLIFVLFSAVNILTVKHPQTWKKHENLEVMWTSFLSFKKIHSSSVSPWALQDRALHFSTNVWLLMPVFVQVTYPWHGDIGDSTPQCSSDPSKRHGWWDLQNYK